MKPLISLVMLLWIWAMRSSGTRMERDVVCRDDVEYLDNNICCLSCPAGTFVKEACSTASERGVCQPCESDTYTEHENGLSNCLPCTKCRSDQEIVEQCNSTRNTHCQCKSGSFCLPDEACEVCKTCRKCKEDEEMVESCTAHSNTVCRKRGPSSANTAIVAVIPVIVAIPIIVIVWYFLCRRQSPGCNTAVASWWPRRKQKSCKEGSAIQAMEEGTPTQPFISHTYLVGEDTVEDEEDKGLGPSLPTTTASSQTSLPLSSECCLSCSLTQPLNILENEKQRRLVPVNGEESLRQSFDLFGEIDINYHNRFFRLLGLSDNAIRTAELSFPLPQDRVYELLKVWMEKEGMKADFNSLIDTLLTLDQKLSAENIKAKAVKCGYFRYEEN